MITPELISFIKGELAKGKLQEQIRSELATGGWNASDLEEAFSFILKIPIQPIHPVQTPPTIKPVQQITTPIAQPVQPIIQSSLITPIQQTQPLQPTTPIIQPIQTGFVSASGPASVKPKSHSKVLLFFIIFLIIFGGAFAGWYFFKPQVKDLLGVNTEKIIPMSDLWNLVGSGKDYECSSSLERKVGDSTITSSSIYYISQGKIKTESDSFFGDKHFLNYTIADGDYVYMWGEAGTPGTKLKQDRTPDSTAKYNNLIEYNNSQVPDEYKIPDLICKTSDVDASKFIPPAEISFQLIEIPQVENNIDDQVFTEDISDYTSEIDVEQKEHLYENIEYNFYLDLPDANTDYSSFGQYPSFVFRPNDQSSHLIVVKVFKGEKSETEKMAKVGIIGSTYAGKKVVNGTEMDLYVFSGEGASDYYLLYKNGIQYLISVQDPLDIKYFGFIK